jgi:hypothetical protein
MDHLNADQRKMAAAMVYPEAKHGGSRKAAQRDRIASRARVKKRMRA